jgi:hypothetical protein
VLREKNKEVKEKLEQTVVNLVGECLFKTFELGRVIYNLVEKFVLSYLLLSVDVRAKSFDYQVQLISVGL